MNPEAPRKSQRLPWFRAGLAPIFLATLPFAWVTETQSCGQAPATEELTGASLLSHFDLETTPVLATAALLIILGAWFAGRLKPGAAALVHLLGLAASGFWAWLVWFGAFFTLFASRALRPAGILAIGVSWAFAAEALVRFGLATREWWRARAGRPPA